MKFAAFLMFSVNGMPFLKGQRNSSLFSIYWNVTVKREIKLNIDSVQSFLMHF